MAAARRAAVSRFGALPAAAVTLEGGSDGAPAPRPQLADILRSSGVTRP
jgi:hypothetical protein